MIFLSSKRLLLVGRRFPSADVFAFEVNKHCSLYLTQLPDYISDSFGKRLKFCGVKNQFEPSDYISCLQEIRGQFGQKPLDERTLQVVVNKAIEESKEELDAEQKMPCFGFSS